MVVFTRRYKWRTTGTLKLGGQQLKIIEQAKYLGVILDKKLTWNEHLENKCKKLVATLWLCRINGEKLELKPGHTDVDLHSDLATQTNICGIGLLEQGRIVNCEISTGKNQRTDSKRSHW